MPARLGNFSALGRPQKNHLTFDTAKVLIKSSGSKFLSLNFVLIFVNEQLLCFPHVIEASFCLFVFFDFKQFA